VDTSAESDGDSRSEADESVSSDPFVDAPSLVVEEELLVDEESLVDDDGPDGSAYAMPGVLAMATPTPRVTASAPTRPTYLA
jgi:hypothetical protein